VTTAKKTPEEQVATAIVWLIRQAKGGNAVSIPASIAACVVLFKSCAGPQIQEQIRPLVETVVDQEIAILAHKQDLARSNRNEVVWERIRDFERRLHAHEVQSR
jgi:hypothetical protein